MAQDSSAVLTYGSAVSFATKSELSPNPSFLSATGFSDVRVFVTRQLASGSVTGSFRNCAWLVVPAEAHSAAAFYNSLLNKQAVNQTPRTTMQRGPSRSFSHEDDRVDSSSLPDDVADELARAEESVQIERAQNAKQAKMREGMPVRYGQEIQLLHINSGKFVTARPQRLAESNAESLLCELDPDGTDDSHFTIMPRYKHRSEGDKVRLTDHIFLFNQGLRMYLNAEALALGWADHMCEVDLSSHTTSWTLKLYTSVNSAAHLNGGDIIRLYHFECEGYLVAEGFAPNSQGPMAAHSSVMLQASNKTVAHDWVLHDETRNTNSYWEIESPDPTDGSDVLYNQPFNLRHVNTGLYLALRRKASTPDPDKRATPSRVRDLQQTRASSPRTAATRRAKAKKMFRSRVKALTLLTQALAHSRSQSLLSRSGSSSSRGRKRPDLFLDMLGEDVQRVNSDDDDDATPGLDSPAPTPPPNIFHKPLFLRQASERAIRPSSPVSFELYLTNKTSRETQFNFQPTMGTGSGFIRRNHALRLFHCSSGLWVHGSKNHPIDSGKRTAQALQTMSVPETPKSASSRRREGGSPQSIDDSSALALLATTVQERDPKKRVIAYEVTGTANLLEQDAFHLAIADVEETKETLFLLSTLPLLQKFVDSMAQRPKRRNSVRGVSPARPASASSGGAGAGASDRDSGAGQGAGGSPTPMVDSDMMAHAFAAARSQFAPSSSPPPLSSESGSSRYKRANRHLAPLQHDSSMKRLASTETLRLTNSMRQNKVPPLPIPQATVDMAKRVLADLVSFVTDARADPFGELPKPSPRRQRLMREHNTAALLVRVLTCSFEPWGGPVSLDAMHPDLIVLCRLAYRVLLVSFMENREAELSVATYINVFIAQIGRGLGAEETLTELLNNNLVLIENLSMDHVTAFVALIRSKGKKPRYLDFLRALCSCRGAGVPVKQELICDIIFGDSSGHYTRVDSKLLGVTNVEAAGASIVMPVRCNAGQVMVAVESALRLEANETLDTILSDYTSSAQRLARPQAWEWVSLSDLFTRASLRAGAVYFSACVKLYVEMCRNRNYVCIEEISNMFPRESLYGAITNRRLGERVRAELLSLLMVLYVDVKPHTSLPVAERTRLWSSLPRRHCAAFSPGLAFATAHSVKEQQWFVSVAQFVRNHLAAGHGVMVTHHREENTLTLSVLRVCQRLLEFGLMGRDAMSHRYRIHSLRGDNARQFEDSISGEFLEFLEALVPALMRLLDGRTDIVPSGVIAAPTPAVPFGDVVPLHEQDNDQAFAPTHTPSLKVAARAAAAKGSRRMSQREIAEAERRGVQLGQSLRGLDSLLPGSRASQLARASPLGTGSAGSPENPDVRAAMAEFASKEATMRAAVPTSRPSSAASASHKRRRRSSVAEQGALHRLRMAAMLAKGIQSSKGVGGGRGRFIANHDNAVVMECKLVICRILQFITRLRLDYQMSQALGLFADQVSMFTPRDFNDGTIAAKRRSSGGRSRLLSHPQIVAAMNGIINDRTLSLDALCPKEDVPAILMDLCMYDNDELTAAAMELATQHYMRYEHLQRALMDVQLLVSPSTVAAYGLVRLLVPRLRLLVETSETWLGMETQDDLTWGSRARDILSQLSDIMWIISVNNDDANLKSLRADMDGSDTDSLGAEWDFHNGLKCNFKDINASLQTILAVTNDEQVEFTYLSVDRERQQLIHNTGAPSLVLTLLKQGSSMLVNRQNADCEISEFVSELFHIFAHCYRFMRTYTFNNQEYLEELSAHVDFLTHLTGQQVFGAQLLADVLGANQSLLKHTTETYMRRLVDHINLQGKVAGLLLPLQSLVWAGQAHLDAHADTLLDLLIERRDTVMELFFDAGEEGLQELAMLYSTPRALAQLEMALCDEGKLSNAPRSKKELRRILTSNLPESTKLWSRWGSRRGGASGRSLGSMGGRPTSGKNLSNIASLRDLKRAESLSQFGVQPAQAAAQDAALKELVRAVTPDRLLYFFQLISLLADIGRGTSSSTLTKLRQLVDLDDAMLALSNPSMPLPLRARLLDLVATTWITNDSPSKRTAQHAGLLSFFSVEFGKLTHLFAVATKERKAALDAEARAEKSRYAAAQVMSRSRSMPGMAALVEGDEDDEDSDGDSTGGQPLEDQAEKLAASLNLDDAAAQAQPGRLATKKSFRSEMLMSEILSETKTPPVDGEEESKSPPDAAAGTEPGPPASWALHDESRADVPTVPDMPVEQQRAPTSASGSVDFVNQPFSFAAGKPPHLRPEAERWRLLHRVPLTYLFGSLLPSLRAYVSAYCPVNSTDEDTVAMISMVLHGLHDFVCREEGGFKSLPLTEQEAHELLTTATLLSQLSFVADGAHAMAEDNDTASDSSDDEPGSPHAQNVIAVPNSGVTFLRSRPSERSMRGPALRRTLTATNSMTMRSSMRAYLAMRSVEAFCVLTVAIHQNDASGAAQAQATMDSLAAQPGASAFPALRRIAEEDDLAMASPRHRPSTNAGGDLAGGVTESKMAPPPSGMPVFSLGRHRNRVVPASSPSLTPKPSLPRLPSEGGDMAKRSKLTGAAAEKRRRRSVTEYIENNANAPLVAAAEPARLTPHASAESGPPAPNYSINSSREIKDKPTYRAILAPKTEGRGASTGDGSAAFVIVEGYWKFLDLVAPLKDGNRTLGGVSTQPTPTMGDAQFKELVHLAINIEERLKLDRPRQRRASVREAKLPSGLFVDTTAERVPLPDRGSRSTDITFEDVMRRLISYAQDVDEESSTDQLRVVLRLVRSIIADMGARNRSYERAMQNLLVQLGALSMVHEQMCRQRNEPELYSELIDTAIALMQNGNTEVQNAWVPMLLERNDPMELFSTILQQAAEQLREQSSGGAGGIAGHLATAKAKLRSASQQSTSKRLRRRYTSGRGTPRAVKVGTRSSSAGSRSAAAASHSFDLHGAMRVLELLQAFCEGHNLTVQNFLREQRGSRHSTVNLVAASVDFLFELQPVVSAANIRLATQTLDTLIEMVQGPCPANQLELVNKKIVEVAGVLLSKDFVKESNAANKVFQYKCALTMASLFEGRHDTMVHERVASLLPMGVMKDSMQGIYEDFQRLHNGVYSDKAFMQPFDGAASLPELTDSYLENKAVLETGFAIFILFRHLMDHDPSVAAALSPSKDGEGVDADGRTSYQRALAFFETHTKSVEIIRDGVLEKFYFPEPPMCTHLTPQTMEDVKWSIDRDGPAKKVQALFSLHADLIAEMKHQQWLHTVISHMTLLRLIPPRSPLWRDLSFLLAIAINMLVLGCYTSTDRNGPLGGSCSSVLYGYETGVSVTFMIQVLGVLQFATSLLVCMFFYLNYGSLIATKNLKRWMTKSKKPGGRPTVAGGSSDDDGEHDEFTFAFAKKATPAGDLALAEAKLVDSKSEQTLSMAEILDLDRRQVGSRASRRGPVQRCWLGARHAAVWTAALLYSPLLFWIAYVTMNVLGLFSHHFFFAFALLDLVNRFEELKLVLLAVYRPAKALMLTALLFLVFEYFFAILGFTYLQDKYDGCEDGLCRNQCSSLYVCLATTFDQGFKNDGGIGAYLGQNLSLSDWGDAEWFIRLVFDHAFNILLLTVMLNIVFGIIIDTFADLRVQKKEKEDDMLNSCFICSIDRAEFDRHAFGFHHHVMFEHNTWNYVYLLAHLHSKPRTEMTGVEDYLRERVASSDLSFFPLHKSLSLLNKPDESSSSSDMFTSDSSSDDAPDAGASMHVVNGNGHGNDDDVQVQVVHSPPVQRRSSMHPRPRFGVVAGAGAGAGAGSGAGAVAGDNAAGMRDQMEAMERLTSRVEQVLDAMKLSRLGRSSRSVSGSPAASQPSSAAPQSATSVAATASKLFPSLAGKLRRRASKKRRAKMLGYGSSFRGGVPGTAPLTKHSRIV